MGDADSATRQEAAVGTAAGRADRVLFRVEGLANGAVAARVAGRTEALPSFRPGLATGVLEFVGHECGRTLVLSGGLSKIKPLCRESFACLSAKSVPNDQPTTQRFFNAKVSKQKLSIAATLRMANTPKKVTALAAKLGNNKPTASPGFENLFN